MFWILLKIMTVVFFSLMSIITLITFRNKNYYSAISYLLFTIYLFFCSLILNNRNNAVIVNHQITYGENPPLISSTKGNINIHATCSSYASPNGENSECIDIVDKEVRKLRKATIAFNTPSKMNKGETYLLTLLLSSNQSSEQLLSRIKEIEKESSVLEHHSNRMKAMLIGENKKAFEIISISPDIQAISKIIGITTWKWDITALEEGQQSLHLTLTAFIDVGGINTELQIKQFDKKIDVEVTLYSQVREFMKDSWKWILGSILFPLIAWRWTQKTLNKPTSEEKS